jgi:ribosomal protein S18 acetylase RimI-like enzyme
MLTFAASMEGTSADVDRARVDPELKHYVDGFGRRGDVGVVALVDQVLAGAAWVRLAPPGPVSPSKVWSDEVPELAIATVPEMRGSGVGTRLLQALFEAARGLHPSVALSVRDGNDAVRLYERLGFSVQRRIVNRVGTTSLVMTREL